MSGARLCTVLGELGIGGYESFEPDSFEWPFQYEEVAPVLNWICSSLRPSNVLSPSELSQYEQLLNEGKFIEGEDLDSAFDSISAFTSKRDNQEALFGADDRVIDIREAKSAFKADALEMQKQLERQKSQFSLLACQVSSLIKGKRARVASIAAVNGQIASLDEKLSARNLEMNAVLGKIASTALELAQYHKGDENTIYLSFSDFHSYLHGDMACAKELNEWFSKQFEKGPFRLVAEEGKSNCSWVSLDDITACLKRGDSEKSYHQRVAELKRLRSIFATSERQWVEAQVENAKQQAILLMLKSQISSDEAHIHHDIHSLRRKQAELVAQLSSLHREESYLFEAIPLLCSELAQLQDTYILQGDYDLKVMRQECYINRQKVYINHLINQLARHRFIKIACQLEKKTMLGVYSLVKVIDSELQSYLSAANSRLGHYLSLIQAASEVREQGAVDDRDTFLHSVRDLLAIYSNSQALLPTYVSSHGIIQQISAVRSDLLSLQLELENSLPEDRRGCVNELCTLIQTLEQPLFASSTTAEPLLTSRPLLRELEEMDKMNSQLSVSVEEVTEAHRQKAEIVKHHPHEVGLERQVFVDFFCNPDRLRNRVRELTARVKAMQK